MNWFFSVSAFGISECWFPAQAAPERLSGSPAKPSARTQNLPIAAAAALVAFALLLSRRGATLTRPQLWDEEGTIIVPDFLHHGWAALWMPLNGYLTVIPRLIGQTALALTPHAYAATSAALAWAFTALVAVAIAAAPTVLRGRLWLAVACLALPSDPEVFGTALYAFWWAALLLMLLPFWEEKPSHVGARFIAIVLCGLSSPIAILTAPLMAVRAALLRTRADTLLAAAAIACAATQLIKVRAAHIPLQPNLSMDMVPVAIEKFFGFFVWHQHLDPADMTPLIVGLAVLAGVLAAAWMIPDRRVALGLLYLLAGSIATAVTRVDLAGLDPIVAGPRYFFYPFILLAWLFIEAAFAAKRHLARLVFVAVLLSALANSVQAGWSRGQDDISWKLHLASCMHFDSYGIPVQFDGHRVYWHADYSRAMCAKLGGAERARRIETGDLYPFAVRAKDLAEDPSGVRVVARDVFGSAAPSVGERGARTIGSFVTGDGDTGEVTLALERGARILFVTDAAADHLRYRITTRGRTFSGRLPLCPAFCTLDFSSDLLPERFSVTLIDAGKADADWFAVGASPARAAQADEP